jgi:DNA polymerase theta
MIIVVASGLSPEEGKIVFADLQRAMKRYVLCNDLFSIYHVTPIYVFVKPDWNLYYKIYVSLEDSLRDVADVIGVRENVLINSTIGNPPKEDSEISLIHRRFFSALMLHDLLQEVPYSKIVDRYKVIKGSLQTLQNSASTFSGMITIFCHHLGWKTLELIIREFQK